jgi:hypothetical protein
MAALQRGAEEGDKNLHRHAGQSQRLLKCLIGVKHAIPLGGFHRQRRRHAMKNML